MSREAIAEFADTMLTRFPPFRQWEDYQEKAWADDLVAELAGFSTEVIGRAQREIIRTRKPSQPRPPMVSECIAACVEARRWLEAQENEKRLPELRVAAGDEWSKERCNLAYDLIKCGMGREAAQDDPCWILALWHFCRKHQRVPDGREIDQCKRNARDLDEGYEQCLRGEAGPAGTMLERLGASMLKGDDWKSRERLCAVVLGR